VYKAGAAVDEAPMNALQQYRTGSEIDTAFCRQKAEECLDLSYQIKDPKGQVAVLKLANWWMRLAENYHSRTATRHKASA
jgi:hypothetical protein